MSQILKEIIEADLLILIEMDFHRIEDDAANRYAKIMIAYYQNDVKTLKEILCKIPIEDMFYSITKLRLAIREKSVETLEIEALGKFIDIDPIWNGELYFISAMAWEKLNNDLNAKINYEKAFYEFKKVGIKRKAVTALHNAIAAESRINPDKIMLANYFYLYEEALHAKALSTAAKCLLNISKEYWQLKGYTIALEYANEGLKLLKPCVGTIDYFLATIHRAHLFLELNQPREALKDLEASKASEFIEVKAAIDVLIKAFEIKFPKNLSENLMKLPNSIKENQLLPNWKERLERILNNTNFEELGDLEQKLLKILTEGPVEKFQLIEKIYGKINNFEAYDNRIKRIINRIRSKFSGLIVYIGGKYQLSDSGYELPGITAA